MRSPEITYDGLRDVIQRTYPAYDVEIWDGQYVVVVPHDAVSAVTAIQFGAELVRWAKEHDAGTVYDSNGGFEFPDGDKLAPDLAFVPWSRLPEVPRSFARAVPLLAVEIRSSKQREKVARERIATLLGKGIDLVVYVDPDRCSFEVHRPGRPPEILGDGDVFAPPEMPGLSVAVREIWPRRRAGEPR
jgi:Uma2 family endonuclease